MGDSAPKGTLFAILGEYRGILTELTALAGALAAFCAVKTLIPAWLNPGIECWHMEAAALVVVLVLTVRHWSRRPASFLKDVKEVNPDRLYGREDEPESWFQHVSNHKLVWLSGESGSGKSALVRLGVKPKLNESRRFDPIYISTWGEDWESGPWESLEAEVAALAPGERVHAENVADILRRRKEQSGRTPVLLLDQFDDYQSMHHDRFLSADGARLNVSDLKSQNRFWATLAALLEQGTVRVLLVSRDDSPYGLECVRLVPPKDTRLSRLQPGVALRLLNEVVGPDAVENPSAGWDEFKSLLLSSVEQDGTLAVRMVRAFRALPYLRGRPIRSGFFQKIGMMSGLESLPLEHHLREAERNSGCDRKLLIKALAEMIDPREPGKTRAVGLPELSSRLALKESEITQLHVALDFLADPSRALVRGLGTQNWRLDHDYLTAAVKTYYDRDGAMARRLSDAEEEFRNRRGASRWWAMLGPVEWFRILREVLERRIALGPHRNYFALSSLRWVVPACLLALIVAAPLIVQRHMEEANNRGTNLLLDLTVAPFPVILPLGEPAQTFASVGRQMYDLPAYARLQVVESALSNESFAAQFYSANNNIDVVYLLIHFDRDLAKSALAEVDRTCDRIRPGSSIGLVCETLYGELDSDYRKNLRFSTNPIGGEPTFGSYIRTDPSVANDALAGFVKSGTPSLISRDNLFGLAKRTPPASVPGLLDGALNNWLKKPNQGSLRVNADLIPALASVASDAEREKAVNRIMSDSGLPSDDRKFAWEIALAGRLLPESLLNDLIVPPFSNCETYPSYDFASVPTDLRVQIVKRFLTLQVDGCALSEVLPPNSAEPAIWQALSPAERTRLVAAAIAWPDLRFWNDGFAATLLLPELTDAQADDLFRKLAVPIAPGFPPNPGISNLALTLKPPLAAEELGRMGSKCQKPEWADVCKLLDHSAPGRAALVENALTAPSLISQDLAMAEADSASALRALETLLSNGSLPQPSIASLEKLKKKLNSDAQKEFSEFVHKAWIAQTGPFSLRDWPYWIVFLSDEDLAAARKSFVPILKNLPYSSDWPELLRKLEPNPTSRSRIALDTLTGVPGIPTLPAIPPIPGVPAPNSALLQFVALDAEEPAWEVVRRTDLTRDMRFAIAQRLCDIHSCGFDVHDRWAFAEWAAHIGQDLSKASGQPSPP